MEGGQYNQGYRERVGSQESNLKFIDSIIN
jgi:hypothetical protein